MKNMTIDIKVESKNNQKWNEQQKKNGNCYCKYAWRNIEWKEIFEMIYFNITILYNNIPSYWETSHINTVLTNLKKLKNKDGYFIRYYNEEETNERINRINILSNHIEELISFFEDYVKNECIIKIY